jgi:rhodanese-related sulfurtransferase
MNKVRILGLVGLLALFLLGLPLAVMAGCDKCEGKAADGEGSGSCNEGACAPAKQKACKTCSMSKVEVKPAEINTAALLVLQRAGVKLQLLEARPGVKDLIPGARVLAAGSDEEKILNALPDKEALYVTYCGSAKCGASGKLAAGLRKLGYRNVIEFRQGWAGWSRHKDGKDLPEAEVNTAALKILKGREVKLHILDARTGKYDDGRRVPGAGSLSASSSAAEVAEILPDKSELVVTYCANLKCPASRMLAAHLRKLGYKNVLEYPQGIDGWVASGYKVEKDK